LVGFFAAGLLAGESAVRTPDEVITLWPGTAPGVSQAKGPERKVEGRPRPFFQLTDIATPTLEVFRAPSEKQIGTAVLVVPGGGLQRGGHAAALAIAARDRGEVPVMFQVLIYPMIDDRTGTDSSVPAHIGTFVWTRESNRSGWEALLGQAPGLATVPPGSVPSRVESLSGLPPAWIGVGALDLFVGEDMEYARRLIEAGIPAQLEVVPGAFHGFDIIVPGAGVSARFTESWRAALQRAFAGT
jgi:hypothetical protein